MMEPVCQGTGRDMVGVAEAFGLATCRMNILLVPKVQDEQCELYQLPLSFCTVLPVVPENWQCESGQTRKGLLDTALEVVGVVEVVAATEVVVEGVMTEGVVVH